MNKIRAYLDGAIVETKAHLGKEEIEQEEREKAELCLSFLERAFDALNGKKIEEPATEQQ